MGSFDFTVEVEDSQGSRTSKSFTVAVAPQPLSITAGPALTAGVVNDAYSVPIGAQGGTRQAYTWIVVDGLLPPGLELSPRGTPAATISGRPTTAGQFDFTIRVEDSAGETATQTLSITVASDTALTITTPSILPTGRLNTFYQATIRAQGGTEQSYQWSVVQGSFPQNVFLAGVGTPETTLSGRLGDSGQFEFTLQVEDSVGSTARKKFVLQVDSAPPELTVITTDLPEAQTEAPYAATISAQGGTGPTYTWSVVQGALPPGLSLQSTGMTTTLSGTPTTPGAFSFRVRVQDSAQEIDERSFTVIVNDGAAVLEIRTLIVPDGQVNVPYSPGGGGPMIIESVGGSGTLRTWTITDGVLPPGLILTADNMQPRFVILSGTPTMRGNYAFRLSVMDEVGNQAARSYFISISP